MQGLNYSVHNDGAHIVIWEGGAIFDFWPGTDRWRMRNFRSEEGVDKLLAAIRERRLVAADVRVLTGMPKVAEKGIDLQSRPSVPPWQDLPSTPEEDEAYVDKTTTAYPHLKGEDG